MSSCVLFGLHCVLISNNDVECHFSVTSLYWLRWEILILAYCVLCVLTRHMQAPRGENVSLGQILKGRFLCRLSFSEVKWCYGSAKPKCKCYNSLQWWWCAHKLTQVGVGAIWQNSE